MTYTQLVLIHDLVNPDKPDTFCDAATMVADIAGRKARLSPEESKAVLSGLFHGLLDSDQLVAAALLAWGRQQFNPEPEEVQRIWKALQTYNRNIFLGSSVLGKTFNIMAHALLDWSRDPLYTNFKLISTTEGHALGNAWPTLLNFHSTSIIELPGNPGAEFITINPKNKHAAMGVIAIPVGDDGKARLQGFHPLPRPKPHPRFGPLTRVRAFLDEGEKVPVGVWDGVDNLESAMNKEGSVKISAATNPSDITSVLAQRAEYPTGWQDFDPDRHFEWDSPMGYHVTRLDAKYSENVIQNRVVFQGLQTPEGYKKLEALGISNPRYWTFGRGAYPTENVEYNIIPPAFLRDCKRTYTWTGLPENVASLDPAFAEGGDEATLTTGRFGMANGTITVLPNGEEIRESFDERYVLYVEQQFPIQKDNTKLMADGLIKILRDLHVRPMHFIMDKTGNGLGLHDILKITYGPDITGLMWSNESTERKILAEDTLSAKERYKDIVSEMWFAFSRWLEYGAVKFSHIVDTHRLFQELSARKYHTKGRFDFVESKNDYKRRTSTQRSPDRADSAIMLVHLCRLRSGENPAMITGPRKEIKSPSDWDWFDEKNKGKLLLPDHIEWMDISEM